MLIQSTSTGDGEPSKGIVQNLLEKHYSGKFGEVHEFRVGFYQELKTNTELKHKVEEALKSKFIEYNQNIAKTIYSSNDFLSKISSKARIERNDGFEKFLLQKIYSQYKIYVIVMEDLN